MKFTVNNLDRAIVLSYHCSIELGCHSDSMSLWHIVALISLFNSSTNSLLLYLFSLAVLLNFCTNSSIVLPPCSNLINFATFTNSSSSPLNSFLISVKNSPTVLYSNSPSSRSSNIFFFHISAASTYIYDNTHWICSSTGAPLILIHIYSLYAMINLATLLELLSNSYSLATSTCILDCDSVAALPVPPRPTCVIIACSAASCFCYCQTTCSKLISC